MVAVAPAAGDFTPRATKGFFGINAQGLALDALSLDRTLLDRQAAAIGRDLGAGWARIPLPWNGAEPLPPVGDLHTYLWAPSDQLVRALAKEGVETSLTVMNTPAWATSAGNLQACSWNPHRAAPTNVQAYAEFAAAAAKRYGPGGRFWELHPNLPYVPSSLEVFNEPNWNGFWCPSPDPALYADFLAESISRIRAVAPETEVIFGGLGVVTEGDTQANGMETRRFIAEVLEARPGIAQGVDAVGLHLYGGAAEINYQLLSWFRSILVDSGMGQTPIYLGEFGWPTRGPGSLPMSEQERAEQLRALAHDLWRSDCGIAGIAPNTWHTREEDPSDIDHWWGIADPLTGTLRATGQAYRDEIALALGEGPVPAPRSIARVCGGDPPDTDEDGVPDHEDDFPLDETQADGSDEVNPEDEATDPEPLHPPRLPADFFAIERGRVEGSAITQGAQLDALAATGAGRVRLAVSWRATEPAAPGSPSYSLDWGHLDSQVYGAARRGLRPQFEVVSKPNWTPLDSNGIATEYARFMGLVAERYGRHGRFWASHPGLDPKPLQDYEVWYAGNWSSTWWDGSASPSEYAAALAKVRAAVRAVDPQARAVASLSAYGSQHTAWAFLGAMGASADGALVTLYGQPTTASEALDLVETVVPATRDALAASGVPGAPLSLQVGWLAGSGGSLTEAHRAQAYRDVLGRLGRSNCGVDAVSIRGWNDASGGYGLADPQTAELNASGRAVGETARLYTGWTNDEPPREPVLLCGPDAPDRDGDGVPDPDDDHPLDPGQGVGAPPETSIEGAPSRHISSTSASFEFRSDSDGSRFLCVLDGGAPEECSSPYEIDGLAEGKHRLEVAAVSVGGRHDPTPEVIEFVVDTVAPQTRIKVARVNRRGPRLLKLKAPGETAVSFRCRLNKGAWGDCPRRYRVPRDLGPGRHRLKAAATDAAGNAEPRAAKLRFRVRR